MTQPLTPDDGNFEQTAELLGIKKPYLPHKIDLGIAYQAPKRMVRRVFLMATGTLDPGYDDISVIRADHMGTFGFRDVGVHVYVNNDGEIQWGRSLERAPEYPKTAEESDIVILIHGHENSMEMAALNTLRALLPVINAVHNNGLHFEGLTKHHARLGIDRWGKLVEPALQAPPEN